MEANRTGEGKSNELDDRIMQEMKTRKEGLSISDINSLTPDLSAMTRSELINRLLQTGNVEMLQQGGASEFSLRYKKNSLPNGTPEEKLVYELIEASENAGIWIRDIRAQSGLSDAQIRKVLKSFEQRKLVKSIKAVGTTKKCYILYGVEADENLTGGTFYSDQQLDSQFVQTLIQVCITLLQARHAEAVEKWPNDLKAQIEFSHVKADAVAKYIHERGVSKVPLSTADIESVLNTAMLDGKVEKRYDNSYRAVSRPTFHSPLVSMPCFYCPMRNECQPGHRISPENCEYLHVSVLQIDTQTLCCSNSKRVKMGGVLSYFRNLFGQREMRILILGLDGAGKTTILYRLHVGEVVTTVPTIGFNVEQVTYKNLKFQVWDLGGQTSIRPYWRCYYLNTDAVIYVVDSADKDRIGISKQELVSMLEEEELKDSILMVIANKQDIAGCLSVAEIHKALGLDALRNRSFQIFKASATKGEGLDEAMEWLAEALQKRV
ncbi:hypothetical protein M3Y96_00074900 [Aphelenchoides besseyi]|nr:hypothetical protein M3Y96_00074900 [Aphelenchoides besseyi]